MPRFSRAAGLAALSILASGLGLAEPAAAQDPAQQPFRGGVTSVAVDVYPRRDGRVVEGLTKDDFEILEDGKPQTVNTLEFIRAEPNTPDAERRDPNTKREGEELAADPHNRVFVIFLDTYHITLDSAVPMRAPLLGFVERTIGANDLFAVLTAEVPPGQMVFARRSETLDNDLKQYFDLGLRNRTYSPVGRPEIERQLQSCMSYATSPLIGDLLVALHREDLLMTNLDDLMVRLGSLRDGRKNLLFISEGWTPQPVVPELANLTTGSIPVIGAGPGGGLTFDPRRTTTGPGQTWCDQQTLRLTSIDFAQRFKDLLERANRANVSFYTVDVGRLRSPMPPLSRPDSRAVLRSLSDAAGRKADNLAAQLLVKMEAPDRTTLQVLAENTDGRAIFNTNDLNAGFRQIADDLSAYYLLGYSSTNAALNGKYRRIQVKVRRPGLDVAARRGYFAAMPAPEKTAGAAPAGAAAIGNELDRLSRLRRDAELFCYGAGRPGALDIVVELGGAELARGRWKDGAEVQASVARPGAPPIEGAARIDPGARSALVRLPIPDDDAGPWRVNLRVAAGGDVATDRLEVAATNPSTALVSAPVAFRGMASTRIPLRPVADFQFRRTERIRVQWPTRRAVDERIARLLDRRGEPLAVPVTVTEGDRTINADLNPAPLSEGDYLIELTAGSGPASERHVFAFRVVR